MENYIEVQGLRLPVVGEITLRPSGKKIPLVKIRLLTGEEEREYIRQNHRRNFLANVGREPENENELETWFDSFIIARLEAEKKRPAADKESTATGQLYNSPQE